MNLYKAAFKEEIYEILKMLKYGLRFLTEKECKALESYSKARWNIQGASLLRQEYLKIMVRHTLQGDETQIQSLLKTSQMLPPWIHRTAVLSFYAIPFMTDLYLSNLPDN